MEYPVDDPAFKHDDQHHCQKENERFETAQHNFPPVLVVKVEVHERRDGCGPDDQEEHKPTLWFSPCR
jgi:hypothetical protein